MIARRLTYLALFGVVLAAPVSKGEDKDKLDLDKIPRAVMKALKDKFPKAVIHKWTKEKEGDAVVYDIEFKEGDRKKEADIQEDGTIVNFEQEIALKDLPEAVKKAVAKKYPKSKLLEAMEVTDIKDKKEVPGGYEITLKTAEGKDVEVVVAADGKILEDSAAEKKDKK